MKRTIGLERGLQIITDLSDPRMEIPALLAKYGVDREDLARWMLTERTQRTLAGLCMLADYQTQLMLSQYRVNAVSRLVNMMAEPKRNEDGKLADGEVAADPDLVRKVCIDVLRLNMEKIAVAARQEKEEVPATPGAALRKLIYGERRGEPTREPGAAGADPSQESTGQGGAADSVTNG